MIQRKFVNPKAGGKGKYGNGGAYAVEPSPEVPKKTRKEKAAEKAEKKAAAAEVEKGKQLAAAPGTPDLSTLPPDKAAGRG